MTVIATRTGNAGRTDLLATLAELTHQLAELAWHGVAQTYRA